MRGRGVVRGVIGRLWYTTMPNTPRTMSRGNQGLMAARWRQTDGSINGVNSSAATSQRKKPISEALMLSAASLLTTVLTDQISTAPSGKR